MPQLLSSRDANLFRQVIRNYEEKEYKRGLKAAEQILKKNPRHGDTMAMKALILNGQGKTDEAFALGKEALTVDMKSHICWHVYGLLYRANKNFEEAIKAYKFALRLEPESPQIQRDLAILQVQMRDYAGYVQSRQAILQARPQQRMHWTGLAIAHHLAGNLAEAEHILTMYEDTLKNEPPRTDVEHSEALLYKNAIIAETGDIQRALDHLESAAADRALDRLAVLETRARYLTLLGADRSTDAAVAWRALIDRNPDNSKYYEGLVQTLGLADDQSPEATATRLAVLDEYSAKYPRSDAPHRLPLNFLTGDLFKERARKYLFPMLDKGIPSLFANVKHLYADEAKKEALRMLVEEYLAAHSSDEAKANGADEKKDASKGEGAALYYLAQHHNYYRSRNLDQADVYCDRAIGLDGKSVDFQMTKARIWKHRGDLQKAADAMDAARQLDTRDRYINSKAAKYRLRNNENEAAIKTMGLFTRPESAADPLADLLEMQCVWYLTEDGEAYARRGNEGLALKRFHAVSAVFDVWQEDQFDFHAFSLRKGMIRAYVDLVRWEDRLREHPFFTRAALDAARLYVAKFDHAQGSGDKTANGTAGANGNASAEASPPSAAEAAEKKKAAKKAKKEALRAEKETAEKAAKQDPNKATAAAADAGEIKKKDDDPLGLKLAATADPLAEATKFVAPVLQFSPKSLEGQLVGFDIYLRRSEFFFLFFLFFFLSFFLFLSFFFSFFLFADCTDKFLLALRCLNAARALDADNARVKEQTAELRRALDATAVAKLPAKVQEVLAAEFKA
ncbi:n-terminal acetyltransferase catalytic subunit [Grosmannia clavigera kw1407]|uniref:N-terminal acetyltransferase catalytic subunit n=1 Tax=Grosmannia clavigera (strain kw1407 / UAMH 11150) TaxID=655863 RepID=F0XJE8_GROCL|nr:n-terminal acetyltransferase catalytic subunit [Grosmannia clavigera kw1407]EFX02154.1 n-terminal acetyltransferase catalytic subunit [Grosmannia clavigera kw1407]